jgi:hypothetical protein
VSIIILKESDLTSEDTLVISEALPNKNLTERLFIPFFPTGIYTYHFAKVFATIIKHKNSFSYQSEFCL